MIINPVFLHNYSNVRLKDNSNKNPNFKGFLKMGKDIRRCCGLYYDNIYKEFSKDWNIRLPKNTGIIVHYEDTQGNYENYIVKSVIIDKNARTLKEYDNEKLSMYTDGISKYGICCRWEDTDIIYDNKKKLLNSLEEHLNKIKERLGIV